jgi:diaminopimelate epimerase
LIDVEGGSLANPSLVGAPELTVTEVLVAVVKALEASVAVRVHEVPVSMTRALNAATPALAVAVVVPARVHDEVTVMESVAPVPVLTTWPVESSTETLRVAKDTPATVVAVGSVVNATLDAAPEFTVTAVLVAALRPVSGGELSVAVKL